LFVLFSGRNKLLDLFLVRGCGNIINFKSLLFW
jgi:hypothetical protein